MAKFEVVHFAWIAIRTSLSPFIFASGQQDYNWHPIRVAMQLLMIAQLI
jgi:hypothetical protein